MGTTFQSNFFVWGQQFVGPTTIVAKNHVQRLKNASVSGSLHCSRDLQTSFFSKIFIKNGSHDTIQIFKIYFATVFSVINSIQTDPYQLRLFSLQYHICKLQYCSCNVNLHYKYNVKEEFPCSNNISSPLIIHNGVH